MSNNHYIFFDTNAAKVATLGHWLNNGIVTQILPGKGATVLVNGSIPTTDLPKAILSRQPTGVWLQWGGNSYANSAKQLGEARSVTDVCFILRGSLFVVPFTKHIASPPPITASFVADTAPAASFVADTAPQPSVPKQKPKKKKSKGKSKSKILLNAYAERASRRKKGQALVI
jgi:hypothetical protein